ncbi:TspO/MBR family protein [Caenispirillum salinarum]|uniref:TspO/MBR family protein n=1 Tax=Caenispirillum salinarum TaxID=859058 RepID=UPI00384E0B28
MDGVWSLLVFIGVNVVAASSGALFPPDDWYARLRKPSWNPPNWLFAPVWSILYLMIAVAGWLVWREAGGWAGAQTAMILYAVQLVLNAAWSGIFFGMKRIGLALAEGLALWAAVAATMALFFSIDPLAGWLFVPYLLWVSFAMFLTGTLLRLNRRAEAAA